MEKKFCDKIGDKQASVISDETTPVSFASVPSVGNNLSAGLTLNLNVLCYRNAAIAVTGLYLGYVNKVNSLF